MLTVTYHDGSTEEVDMSYGGRLKTENGVLEYSYNEDFRGLYRDAKAWPLESIRKYEVKEL
jgi:hypothetical protein